MYVNPYQPPKMPPDSLAKDVSDAPAIKWDRWLGWLVVAGMVNAILAALYLALIYLNGVR